MGFRLIARFVCALAVAFSVVAALPGGANAATEEPLVGYWSANSVGLVIPHGDAPLLGGMESIQLTAPIVGIAATSDGRGYWLAAADGGVFAFGNARFAGSAANLHLNAPIVGIAGDGKSGYLLAASDGGVFAFGNAPFLGSAANLHLHAPVVGIAAMAGGYALAASDGGVFTFGRAKFLGSAANLHLHAPIVGIASSDSFIFGQGPRDAYMLVAGDGGVFTYGDAVFSGTAPSGATAIIGSEFDGYVVQSAFLNISAFGNASSCVEPAYAIPALFGPIPRFVGIAGAFRPGRGDVEGSMATVSCPRMGGHTGAFHAPGKWHIDVGKSFADGGAACFAEVFARDRVDGQPVPTEPLVAKYGSIEMRTTQMAGHSAFDVRVTGTNCRAVADRSFFANSLLPLAATTRPGDIGPFVEIDPINTTHILSAHGTCATEVRADTDGRLLDHKSGSAYTMTLPAGGYWISNTRDCTVSIT